MLQDIKHTISQSAIYGLSRVADKAISFILLPLYTSIFSSSIIGNINLLESLWNYLFTICLFSFETAIIAFCASERDKNKVRGILFMFLVLLLSNCLFFVTAGYFISGKTALYVLQDGSLQRVAYYCFLISAAEAAFTLPLTLARLENRAVLYTTVSVIKIALNLGLQLLFLVVYKLDFEYIFIAKILAPAILFLFLLPYYIKAVKPMFGKGILKQILKFSAPLMIASLVSMLLNTVDRYVISDFVSKSEVAIYTVGYGIGSLTNFFVVSPFVLAFNVFSWKKLNDSNAARFFTKSATYLYFIMILLSMLVCFYIPYFIKIFVRNPELWASIDIIRIILFSNCVASLAYVSLQSFYFKKKTSLILLVYVIALTVKLLANFAAVKSLGIYSSAYISILSYLVLILLSYNIAKSYYFIRFENYKLVILSLVYLLTMYLMMNFHIETAVWDIVFKAGIFLASILILYLLKFFEPIELERIRTISNKYLFKHLNRRD